VVVGGGQSGAAEERPAKSESQSRCGGGCSLDHNRLRYGGVAAVEAQHLPGGDEVMSCRGDPRGRGRAGWSAMTTKGTRCEED
jgi:hypothetical protein